MLEHWFARERGKTVVCFDPRFFNLDGVKGEETVRKELGVRAISR